MATIDNLDIQISASAQKANQAIDSLVKNLNRLTTSLKIDTSGLEKIGKSLNFGGIANSAKNIQSQTQKVSKSLSQITEQYKDLGKGFEIKGSAQQIQKQIDSLQNQLAKAKLAKEDFEMSGKTDLGGYETAVKNVIKYTNQIESLKNQLKSVNEVKIQPDFGNTEDLIERMKTQIRQNMEGVRIENPIDLAALSEKDFSMFTRLKSEMEQTAQLAKNMGEQINESISHAGMQSYDSAEIQKFIDDYASASAKISGLDLKTEQFEQSLKNLQIPPINTEKINVLQRELSKSEANFEKLRAKLANGITMGRISANVDDKGYRNLREQMALAEKTAESLRGKIKQVQDASNQTSTGSRKLGNSLKLASGFMANFTNSSTRAIKPLNNLGNSFKSLIRTMLPILGIRQLFNWGKQAIDVSSDLTEVQNVVDVTFGNMAYKIDELASHSIQDFGMSELTAKQISSRFQAMGTAIGFSQDKMSDMSIELTKLAADMASFYNVEQEDVAKSLESVFTGQTRPLRTYGLDLTQATLQEWAFKKGLDANVQSMSQAEKTMLRYQYVLEHTGAAQGDFARTSDTWANQTRILVQNMERLASAIGGNLTRALKPLIKALNVAMDYVVSFAKTVSSALGKIFGWKYEVGGGGLAQDFEDASEYAEDLAGSTGQAAKNIKKMQAGLRAFDELKVINMPEDTDGAGGGSSGGAGGIGGYVADSGEWIKENSLLDFESELNTLYKLGDYINKTLIDVMDRIDWDSVYEKARNFGKGLADFLNGLISPELFGSVGKTIANSLNTAIYSVLSFGETFDFEEFGLSIAEGINDFFNNFDFDSLSKTINVWAYGIWTVIKTALFGEEEGEGGIDFESISKKIKKFFSDLEGPAKTFLVIFSAPIIVAGIGSIITKVFELIEAFTRLSALFAEGGAFAGISALFAEGGIFSGISAGPIATVTLAITAMVAAIVDAWNTSEEFRNAVSNTFQTVKDSLSNAFESIKEKLEPLGESIKELGENFYSFYQNSGLQDLVAQILTWDAQLKGLEMSIVIDAITKALKFMITQLTGVIDFLSGLFEILDGIFSLDFDKISEGFGTLAKGLFEAILGQTPDEFAEKIVDFFTKINWGEILGNILIGIEKITKEIPVELFNLIIEGIADLGDKISQSFSEIGMYGIAGFFDGISENLRISANWIRSTFDKLFIQPIKDFFGIHSPSTLFAELGRYIVEGLKVGISSSIQTVINIFKNSWESIKGIWTNVSNWFSTTVIQPVQNAFLIACNAIGSFFSDIWSGIVKGAASAMNVVISTIESAINNIVRGINGIIGGFNKIVTASEKITGANWSTVSLGKINVRGYAKGGYDIPEDGWFRVSKGEFLGEFDDGTKYISNNKQIVQGIEDAVYPAVYNAVSAALKNNNATNANPEIRVFVGDREITDIVVQGITERAERTQKMPFPIYV